MFANYRKHKKIFVDKRLKIVKKLVDKGMSEQEIVDYFLYPGMSKKEPGFCILYGCDKVCHSLPREKLNCFDCYCPYYELVVWNDGEKDITGRCAMGSEYMTFFTTATGEQILDCSNCWFPHTEKVVKKSLKAFLSTKR
jgi:Zn-finger protein